MTTITAFYKRSTFYFEQLSHRSKSWGIHDRF